MPSQQDGPHQSADDFARRDIAWRRAGKIYVLLHALISTCMFLGVIGVGGSAIGLVAVVGSIPFVVSSPILSFIMVFVLSRRHREWLYLGLCDAALLAFLVFSTYVGGL
jgi:hypothetical protein